MQPLRPHQVDAVERVTECWRAGDKDVCLVLPTGSGKTRVMAEFTRLEKGITLVVAHRKELVSQIALAVATQKVKHRFIAQKSAIKFATNQQMSKLGYSYFVPAANVVIASAQTLVNAKYERWHDDVTLYMTDESHHLTKGSTWGTCREKFKNARGLGVTATPWRADGKGLGRHASGYFDSMVIGPCMRDIIKLGHLSDYDLVIEETDLDLTSVAISQKTGDFTKPSLSKAMEQSKIVGDTVDTWKQYANGRLTVVFTIDVKSSEELAEEFRQNGVSAEAISAKNSDEERSAILKRFENKKTLVLVNCDLFSEGFDCPAIDCVIMDRPTESYSLFCQQFGRALRYVPGKRALIIDKVGNIRRFMARGFPLPDNHYHWSLDDAEKKSAGKSEDTESVTTCTNVPACGFPYPSDLACCPYCGEVPIKTERKGPPRVEGNLTLLTPEELEELRSALIDTSRDPNSVKEMMLKAGAPTVAAMGAAKNIRLLNEAQNNLRESIAVWAGRQRDNGLSAEEAMKKFYKTFGIDIMTAQSLNRKEAEKLNESIQAV